MGVSTALHRDAVVDRDSADNNLTVTFKTFVRERETANMFYILYTCDCVTVLLTTLRYYNMNYICNISQD